MVLEAPPSANDFYNWNRILVRYCDGSSFTGDVEEVEPISNILAPTENGRNGSWFECQYNYKKCLHSQIRTLQDFRLQFLRALSSGLANSSSRGMFINSCYTHCQSEFPKKWYGDPASKLDKKAIGEAVGDWFYDRTAFQHIDYKHLKPHKCVLNPKEPNPKNNYTWGDCVDSNALAYQFDKGIGEGANNWLVHLSHIVFKFYFPYIYPFDCA
ncbi:hypothetical protein LguiB_028400 [Lonicera macranthoides]